MNFVTSLEAFQSHTDEIKAFLISMTTNFRPTPRLARTSPFITVEKDLMMMMPSLSGFTII